jgi:hypothetical protein
MIIPGQRVGVLNLVAKHNNWPVFSCLAKIQQQMRRLMNANGIHAASWHDANTQREHN